MADDQQTGGSPGRTGLGVGAGVVGVLMLLCIGSLAVVYSGAVNVAATEEHMSLTRWAFDTTFRNSVERRAAGVAVPDNLTSEMMAAGARAYRSMCQHCHAGPGVERSKWAGGMRPRPPHLTERAAGWTPQEVFWIVKHGIRMTGMPAFGPTHDDRTLWGIAAFVKELPAMTPERYAALGREPGEGAEAQDDGGR